MFKPMPSPRGTNREGLFVPARFVPSSPVAAYDAIGGLTSRKPTAPASGPARKPMTSPAPSASPRPSMPKKPAADAPSRQENLQALLDFLSANLPSDLFSQVETELMERFAEEPETSPQAAARRRVAADSASTDKSFFTRFPAAKKIGTA